jgi:hypothetical protein
MAQVFPLDMLKKPVVVRTSTYSYRGVFQSIEFMSNKPFLKLDTDGVTTYISIEKIHDIKESA